MANSEPGGDRLSERKAAHLEICLDESLPIESGQTRYDEVDFVHRAMPEIDADEVSTSSSLFGIPVRMPLFISSMTGGSSDGYRLNRLLAEAARELGIAVGMGSIRILLKKPELKPHFALKEIANTVPVFANIGGVQVAVESHDALFRLLDELNVDAVAVHLNPGQELFQEDGDRDFRGILSAIERFCSRSPVPVVVKETGFGIDPVSIASLRSRGVYAVDLAGSGGTNWINVEALRTPESPKGADEFAGWGFPTALLQVALGRGVDSAARTGILASGGIRSGMDTAKAIALGADGVGMALPFIRSVTTGGVNDAVTFGRGIESVLKTVMTLTGSPDIPALRRVPLRIGRALRNDAAELQSALDLP